MTNYLFAQLNMFCLQHKAQEIQFKVHALAYSKYNCVVQIEILFESGFNIKQ